VWMMRRLLIALSGAILSCVVSPASAQTAQPFVGEVATFPYTFCPKGWAPLNGQLMAISQNTALFSLLGTNYGGDGKSTFALPLGKPIQTLTPGAPVIQCIALQGIFPPRN
jgi:microcystin-dependent protein